MRKLVVSIRYEDRTGAHEVDEIVSFPDDTPEEVAQIDRLIEYGVLRTTLIGVTAPDA